MHDPTCTTVALHYPITPGLEQPCKHVEEIEEGWIAHSVLTGVLLVLQEPRPAAGCRAQQARQGTGADPEGPVRPEVRP